MMRLTMLALTAMCLSTAPLAAQATTPKAGMAKGDAMKQDAMTKGDAMKKDGMAKGDAMKKDAMAKGDAMKPATDPCVPAATDKKDQMGKKAPR